MSLSSFLLCKHFANINEDQNDDTLVKYLAMFQRRAEKGQCFTQPAFGCREFPAYFELVDEPAMQVPAGTNADADLGLMLYDVFDLDVSKDQLPSGTLAAIASTIISKNPGVSVDKFEIVDGKAHFVGTYPDKTYLEPN